jgi:hypothetical protein
VSTITKLQGIVHEINRQYDLTPKQIVELVETSKFELKIPLQIFQNRNLGIFETIVKFMHENHSLSFIEISKLVNRDNRTIWCSYHNANKKVPYKFKPKQTSETIMIPIEIFSYRENGLLVTLVKYCNQELNLTNSKIAKLIDRNYKTIWAVSKK